MFKTLTFFALFSLSFAAFSQKTNVKSDTITKYFTKYWKEVPDKSQAYYYDKYVFKDSVWLFKEYYMSGKLAADGGYFKEFKDNIFSKQCGTILTYREDGTLKSKSPRFDSKRIGETQDFFKNGIVEFIYKYDTLGKLIELKHFYESGKIDGMINYINGKIIKERYFKEDGSASKFENAEYIGGLPAMYQFLQENIKYPKKAQKRNIQGKVYLSFDICDDGSLCNYEVLDSPNEMLSDEAIRVVSSMSNWKPAIRDGKKLSTKFIMPVVFKLE